MILRLHQYINFSVVFDGYEVTLSVNITNTSATDYGEYQCKAMNIYGEENSTVLMINVQCESLVTLLS